MCARSSFEPLRLFRVARAQILWAQPGDLEKPIKLLRSRPQSSRCGVGLAKLENFPTKKLASFSAINILPPQILFSTRSDH